MPKHFNLLNKQIFWWTLQGQKRVLQSRERRGKLHPEIWAAAWEICSIESKEFPVAACSFFFFIFWVRVESIWKEWEQPEVWNHIRGGFLSFRSFSDVPISDYVGCLSHRSGRDSCPTPVRCSNQFSSFTRAISGKKVKNWSNSALRLTIEALLYPAAEVIC